MTLDPSMRLAGEDIPTADGEGGGRVGTGRTEGNGAEARGADGVGATGEDGPMVGRGEKREGGLGSALWSRKPRARSVGWESNETEQLKDLSGPVVLKLVKCPKGTKTEIAQQYGLAATACGDAVGGRLRDRRQRLP